jgi:hypothetical protein
MALDVSQNQQERDSADDGKPVQRHRRFHGGGRPGSDDLIVDFPAASRCPLLRAGEAVGPEGIGCLEPCGHTEVARIRLLELKVGYIFNDSEPYR